MKHINTIFICIVTTCFLLSIGCTKEVSVDETGGTSTGEATIRLALNTPGAATKGMTSVLEDAVKSVDVLVFDSNDKLFDMKNAILTQNSGVISFEALYRVSKDNSDTYRLVVLANVRPAINTLFGGDKINGQKGKSYTDVIAMLETVASSTVTEWQESGLPMWGEYASPIKIAHGATFPPINLTRSVARIDVGINPTPTYKTDGSANWAKHNDFSLEQVIIYKAGKKYLIAPKRSDYDFTNKVVNDINVPTTQTLFSPHPKYLVEAANRDGGVATGKGIHISSQIYIPEVDVNMGSGAYYLDGNHLSRIAMVVGGYYKNSTQMSYYRIDFIKSEDRTKLNDLRRNHCYQAVIKDVIGSGFPDPDEAYRSYVSEIEATINDWVKTEVGTVFDGANRLTLTRDMIFCGNEGSVSGTFENVVKTTNTTDPLTITGPFNKGTTNTATWVANPLVSSVTTVNDPELGQVKTATITIGQIPAFSTDREAYFLVKSGNLEYEYRIVQSKDKWITVTPFPDGNCYPMDGDLHWMNVTSSTDWQVDIANGNQSNVINDLHTHSGGRKVGEYVYFNTFDDVNKGLKEESHVTFKYTDPKGICPAENVTVPIVTGIVVPAAQDANCYMLDPTPTKKSGIYIPIGRANQAIANSIEDMDALSSEFVWTDNSAGASKDNSSVKYYVKSGRGKTGYLFVQQGKTDRTADGNTVVAIKTNNTIRWSWHIWTTNYAPSGTWMNRNIGATTNTPNTASTLGFHYQWGRKDPFPGSASTISNTTTIPIYNSKSVATSVTTNTDPLPASNLANAIKNPLTFYYATSSVLDWYGTTQNNNLWNGTDGKKTVYDPCPKGWRVPVNGSWPTISNSNGGVWNHGYTWESYGGYYPAEGYRLSDTYEFRYVGGYGTYWSATATVITAYHMHYDNGGIGIGVSPSSATHRYNGISVRCKAE